MRLVVEAPLFVMVWRVAVVAAAPGQFVPFRRQTEEPFTWMEEAFNVVPEAVAKPNQPVEVPFVKERLVTVPFVAKRLVVVELVEVVFVKTPVDGVVAPIGELLMVPPLIVRMSETFASPRVPVMEPKLPSANVTPALPSVPDLMAEALTLPVASIVSPFTTIASVTESFGRLRLPVTAKLVVVALVEVTFVTMRLPSVVWPVTFNVPVAVRFRVWMPPKA
jgi:hypothetical protein